MTAVPVGHDAALAYWDDTQAAWIPVPSTVSPDRRTVAAHVTHFSRWDVVYWLAARCSPSG